MSRTAFTAKLAMASRLSMVAAMVTVLPASADTVMQLTSKELFLLIQRFRQA